MRPSAVLSVDYRVLTGTATSGADFDPGPGRVQFAAGDRVRYIPLRILPDSLAEGTETIVLGLDETRTDLVVGSPCVVRVKIDPPR